MTEIANPVIRSDGRLERVLDAAADLLVRWGYQRVTIDDVARHAGIGKGTVYLHFRSKDALFLTVLLRSHRGVVGRIADRIDADPADVLPSRMSAAIYRELSADPVARALYLGDPEILGRLAHEGAETLGELARRRDAVAHQLFERMRAERVLRAELTAGEHMYLFSAVAGGFFFVDGLPLPTAPTDPGRRAELLRAAVAAAMEEPGAAARARAVAPEAARLYRSLVAHIDDEWKRRVR